MKYGIAIVGLMGLGVLGIVFRAKAWETLRPWSAEDQYRLAERCFQRGDFEKSRLECQRALRRNPIHAPSRALFTEVSFILGEGKATPSRIDYSPYMRSGKVLADRSTSEP